MRRVEERPDHPATNGKMSPSSSTEPVPADTEVPGPEQLVRALLEREKDLDKAELAERLCIDQVERWREGLRIPAEAYLSSHPSLRGDFEASFELIYGEYILRESMGESPELREFLCRFPRFADRLRRQLGLHRALETEPGDAGPQSRPAVPILSSADEPGRPDEAPGPSLPGYQILGELGHGGMGVVYKARHRSLNRLVALKVIRAGAYAGPEVAARFRAEAEMVARFQHPNIIQVYEVGDHEGIEYLALEYAAGGSLQEKLAGNPQDPAAAAALAETLARVVHYAHQRGIVHRDLKPANVVLTEEGIPKVTDFGLAKLLEHEEGLTSTEAILGTPSYMAPEQVRGDSREITPAADVYALGAILYEMLTGRPPFKGATPLSTLEQVASQEPLAPSSLQRHLPRDLETICLKCLEKEIHRRYASAWELADDLRRFLDGRPITAHPTSTWRRVWKWAKRRPSTATALGSVAAAVLVLLAGALDYNTRLRLAVKQARAAEQRAETSARSAVEQRNLALKAFDELIYQEKLGETPQTRSFRRSILNAAIVGLEELARSAEASLPDLSRAVAHQKLGKIFQEVGRHADARRQLEQAQRLAEHLAAAAPRDLSITECLLKTYNGLGLLNLAEHRGPGAMFSFTRAVQLAQILVAADPKGEPARRNLISAYLELGRAYGFGGNLGEAEVWFNKSLDLSNQWTREAPGNTQAAELKAWSYRKLADMRKLSLDPAKARKFYLEAIRLGHGLLAAEPANAEFKLNLAVALHDLARLSLAQRELVQARPPFQEAERLLLELTLADPENLGTQIWLIRAQCDLARLEREEQEFARAAAQFRSARDRLRRLRREGRLDGREELRVHLIHDLDLEIRDCESVSVALGDLGAVRSRPPGEAIRLLLVRARTRASQGQLAEVVAALEALCRLESEQAGDLFEQARCLAEAAGCLDDVRWPGIPAPDRHTLRTRCHDRALAVLARAVERGFDDLERLETDIALAGLRRTPAYRDLVLRLKTPPPSAPGPRPDTRPTATQPS